MIPALLGPKAQGPFFLFYSYLYPPEVVTVSFLGLKELHSHVLEDQMHFETNMQKDIFDTSPALRWLNKMTCVKVIFANCVHVCGDVSVDNLL